MEWPSLPGQTWPDQIWTAPLVSKKDLYRLTHRAIAQSWPDLAKTTHVQTRLAKTHSLKKCKFMARPYLAKPNCYVFSYGKLFYLELATISDN